METLETYLDRKHRELELLNGCLLRPSPLKRPASVAEVIERKFHVAAALKAEHALHDWAHTETDWAHEGRPRAGPFRFSYDYQRADLEVRGPSFYEFECAARSDTLYTSSGMGAISALLLASAHVTPAADILVLPGTYGETLELIKGYARHFRLISLEGSQDELAAQSARPRVMLLDSCTSAAAFEAVLNCAKPDFELVVFDTTCFSNGSGRIRRVVNWARRRQLPIVLVRSHTKLDSLGVEYGRLGSAVFMSGARQEWLTQLAAETRNAVRLLGSAALPAHFPPYVGTRAYRVLTNKRVATILQNSRRAARIFGATLRCSFDQPHIAHGLYMTLASKRALDEQQARRIAADMSRDLSKIGLPLRHAGSFGFDFAATEWFHDATNDRYAVRIAVPDLPTAQWDEVAHAVARWWSAHEGRGASAGMHRTPATAS
jgi:hypothetical protein